MTAHDTARAIMRALAARFDLPLDYGDALTLARAERTLQRWAERECGDSDHRRSIYVERDEATGRPFEIIQPHDGSRTLRFQVPDRETGALRRVAAVCKRNGLHYYHQTDPRGCMLYVSPEPLPENDYTRGVACCA